MDFSKKFRFSLLSFLYLLFLTACNSSHATSIAEVAEKIRFAVNNNNIEQFHSLTTLPLTIYEQEWESAQDGMGFVLGKFTQKDISTTSKFKAIIPDFLVSLQIEGKTPITDISLDMFKDELGNKLTFWKRFNLVLFKRGEGDVEHIVLMGLNKTTNKLSAIYIN